MMADGIVTLSNWMKKRITEIYGLDSSIVRPGVDTDFFRIEKNTVRKHMFLSIGALWPFKGHKRKKQRMRPILLEYEWSLFTHIFRIFSTSF